MFLSVPPNHFHDARRGGRSHWSMALVLCMTAFALYSPQWPWRVCADIDDWLLDQYASLSRCGFHEVAPERKVEILDHMDLRQFLYDMPKGMDLHSHLVGRGSRKELLRRVAHHQPGRWLVLKRDHVQPWVEVVPRGAIPNSSSVLEMRRLEDVVELRDWMSHFAFRGSLTLHSASSDVSHEAWDAFIKSGFDSLRVLLSQREVFRDIFLPLVMEELVNMSMFGFEPRLNPFTALWSAHPDELGDTTGKEYIQHLVGSSKQYGIECNIIISFNRLRDMPDQYIQKVAELVARFGSHVKGFDFVGHEDIGKPLAYYRDAVRGLESLGLSFVPHAGESNWHTPTVRAQQNVCEAMKMGCLRIGHCLACDHTCTQNVWKELCPISNLVLHYGPKDLRLTPTNGFSLERITVGSDDPAVTDTDINYDLAVVSFTRRLWFQDFKRLQYNSIEASLSNKTRKNELKSKLRNSFDVWLHSLRTRPRLSICSGDGVANPVHVS